MGNYNTRPVKFRQSVADFPLTVALGGNVPAWGLSRSGMELRFRPSDDEGFILRGHKQRLVYKGRKRSHRFTILGNTAFEYDCILLREPESNVVSLVMDGADCFIFYRQPDFVPDPFLKGSYAVYRKEIFLGGGTGKLCHIHRPQIIDANGRRCWGDLSVVGNELQITIPEKWLGEAAYPVVVDPTIGTTTIGSQIKGPNPNLPYCDRPTIENEFLMNKYMIPENGNGVCTAYVYCYHNDTDSTALPFLYTNVNNKPYKRKSKNEKNIDIEVWGGKPVGWRNNTFTLDGSIAAGENIWFGLFSSLFTTRFDYGGDCYKGWFDWDEYEDYEGEPTPYVNVDVPWVSYCNIKWSMYFTYTAVTSQNYVRILTQGLTLTDSRKLTANYKRYTTQTVQAESIITGFRTICRKIQEAVQGFDVFSFQVFYIRNTDETVSITESINRLWSAFRKLYDTAEIECEAKGGWFLVTKILDTVHAAGVAFRGLTIAVRILTGSFVRDYVLCRFLKARQELILKSCISREIELDSRIG